MNCSQKSITIIDSLPFVYTSIETLILSRNLLTSLKGIQQFSKLRILDISYNDIRDLNEILYLKDLKHLETLICEFNPINENSAFVDTVVALVSGLRILNTKVLCYFTKDNNSFGVV